MTGHCHGSSKGNWVGYRNSAPRRGHFRGRAVEKTCGFAVEGCGFCEKAVEQLLSTLACFTGTLPDFTELFPVFSALHSSPLCFLPNSFLWASDCPCFPLRIFLFLNRRPFTRQEHESFGISKW